MNGKQGAPAGRGVGQWKIFATRCGRADLCLPFGHLLAEVGETVPLGEVGFEEGGIGTVAEAHEGVAEESLFVFVFVGGEATGDPGEAEPEEIGGDGVEAVVLDNFAEAAGLPEVEDLVAVRVELAGDAAEGGGLVEGDGGVAAAEAAAFGEK